MSKEGISKFEKILIIILMVIITSVATLAFFEVELSLWVSLPIVITGMGFLVWYGLIRKKK